MSRVWPRRYKKRMIAILVGIVSLIYVFPIYWMFILGTNNLDSVNRFPPPLLPGTALAENFQRIMEGIPFFQALWNSFYTASIHTLLLLFIASFAGYGFARFQDAPGHRWLFYFVIVTIMIPGIAGLIPWFMLMKTFGWLNTHLPLIVPGAGNFFEGTSNAFAVFWLCQYIKKAVPYELYEAAKMDGATDWQVYYKIVLPLIRPGLAGIAILIFLGRWNSFKVPLIILNDQSKFTLPLALTNLNSLYATDIPAVMLGTGIGVLPLFVVFLLCAKQFIAGLTSGSVKS